jgi:hypothetical protein
LSLFLHKIELAEVHLLKVSEVVDNRLTGVSIRVGLALRKPGVRFLEEASESCLLTDIKGFIALSPKCAVVGLLVPELFHDAMSQLWNRYLEFFFQLPRIKCIIEEARRGGAIFESLVFLVSEPVDVFQG